MRKTNYNLNRTVLIKKIVTRFIICQFFLALLFAGAIYSSKPAKLADCEKALITVVDKEIAPAYGENRCRIYTEDTSYDFPTSVRSTSQIYDEILVGQNINIVFVTEHSAFGEYKLIVDARDRYKIYYDFHEYIVQKEKAYIAIMILFGILEFAFVFLITLVIIYHRKELFRKTKYNKNST